jgi:hypothetical protein
MGRILHCNGWDPVPHGSAMICSPVFRCCGSGLIESGSGSSISNKSGSVFMKFINSLLFSGSFCPPGSGSPTQLHPNPDPHWQYSMPYGSVYFTNLMNNKKNELKKSAFRECDSKAWICKEVNWWIRIRNSTY